MDWQALFLNANGRIGRRDFWLGFVIIFAVNIVAGFIPIIGQLVGLALIYPLVCLYSKRLHDMGKSGWLTALPFVVMIVCMIAAFALGGAAMISGMAGAGSDAANAGAAMAGAGIALGVMGLAFVFGLGFLLWVGLTLGQPETNQYGPPPIEAPLGTA